MDYKFKPINSKIKGYDYGKLYNETSDEDYDDYFDYDDYEEEEYTDCMFLSCHVRVSE